MSSLHARETLGKNVLVVQDTKKRHCCGSPGVFYDNVDCIYSLLEIPNLQYLVILANFI